MKPREGWNEKPGAQVAIAPWTSCNTPLTALGKQIWYRLTVKTRRAHKSKRANKKENTAPEFIQARQRIHQSCSLENQSIFVCFPQLISYPKIRNRTSGLTKGLLCRQREAHRCEHQSARGHRAIVTQTFGGGDGYYSGRKVFTEATLMSWTLFIWACSAPRQTAKPLTLIDLTNYRI